MKENGNGTFPSKVVSNPSKGNFKVNLTVNVQSLVILGIKNRLCRDNNLCESESKSIKDWYASDKTNTDVKTKNDEHLNHMTDYDWLTTSRIKWFDFYTYDFQCLYSSLFIQEFFRLDKIPRENQYGKKNAMRNSVKVSRVSIEYKKVRIILYGMSQ